MASFVLRCYSFCRFYCSALSQSSFSSENLSLSDFTSFLYHFVQKFHNFFYHFGELFLKIWEMIWACYCLRQFDEFSKSKKFTLETRRYDTLLLIFRFYCLLLWQKSIKKFRCFFLSIRRHQKNISKLTDLYFSISGRKSELLNELHQLVKGNVGKIIFAHDTVRVIECLVAQG